MQERRSTEADLTKRDFLGILLGAAAAAGFGGTVEAKESASKPAPLRIIELGRGPVIAKTTGTLEERRAMLFTDRYLSEAADIFVTSGDLHPSVRDQFIQAFKQEGVQGSRYQITMGLEADAMLGRNRRGVVADVAPGERKLIFELKRSEQGKAELFRFQLRNGSVRQNVAVLIPEECMNITLLDTSLVFPEEQAHTCPVAGWGGTRMDYLENTRFSNGGTDALFVRYNGSMPDEVVFKKMIAVKHDALQISSWYGQDVFMVEVDQNCDGHPELIFCVDTKAARRGTVELKPSTTVIDSYALAAAKEHYGHILPKHWILDLVEKGMGANIDYNRINDLKLDPARKIELQKFFLSL